MVNCQHTKRCLVYSCSTFVISSLNGNAVCFIISFTLAWTHRFNPSGPDLPEYSLFDQIWVSQALAGRFANPTIDRRTKHKGDGSDHDPAWIDIDL
ncbi:MAG: hypothetical protein WBN77_04075 [Desulfobacterales bacterium]